MTSKGFKALITLLIALSSMMAFANGAMASRGIITSGLLALFSGTTTLTQDNGIVIICNLVLGTSIRPLILKRTNEVLATIGSALSRISGCNGGISGVITNDTNILYQGFTGTLPNISLSAARTAAAGFRLTGGVLGATGCNFAASSSALTVNLLGSGSLTGAGFGGTVTGSGVAPCPRTASLVSSTLRILGLSTIPITLQN